MHTLQIILRHQVTFLVLVMAQALRLHPKPSAVWITVLRLFRQYENFLQTSCVSSSATSPYLRNFILDDTLKRKATTSYLRSDPSQNGAGVFCFAVLLYLTDHEYSKFTRL